MDKKLINEIFATFAKNNSNPTIELKYINGYTLLVATILSARTTDISVNKITDKLFKVTSSPEDMLQLGESKLKEYIKTIGLFNAKAKNIVAMSKVLIEKFESTVPSTLEELTSLPGVGRKTAKVILNTLFHQPVIAVDTHVFRTSRRIGLSSGSSVEKVERDLENVIPKKWKSHAHHWLVLHGRYTCKAIKPLCERCIISKFCNYYKNLFA